MVAIKHNVDSFGLLLSQIDLYAIILWCEWTLGVFGCAWQGVLRIPETLQKFKSSVRFQPGGAGGKAPILSYCEALMQSAGAYRAVSLAEALVCAQCVLEQGRLDSGGMDNFFSFCSLRFVDVGVVVPVCMPWHVKSY